MKNTWTLVRRIVWAGILGGESIVLCFIIPIGDFFWFTLVSGVALAALGVVISEQVHR